MEGKNLKKRHATQNELYEGSKRLHLEVNDDENTTDPSSLTSAQVDSHNISSTSSSSSDDDSDHCDLINLETKNLYFLPVDPSGENHLEKFDEYSQNEKLYKLKCIDIDLTHIIEDSDDARDEEISEILNRIFLASVDSLEEIIFRNPIGYLPGLVIPVMKKVVKLQLLFYWWGTDATNVSGCLRAGEIFPKGFKFSALPKLEEVVIKLETEAGSPLYYTKFDCWKNNLKSCGIARGVKKIAYYDQCGFLTTRLKTTFPKATWPDNFREVIKYPSSESSSEDLDSSSEDDSSSGDES